MPRNKILQFRAHKRDTLPSDSHSERLPAKWFRYIKWYDYALLVLAAAFYLVFVQPTGDLWHTALSSFAYLQGHITDFYDYNLIRVGGDDYYPFMYVIFAIWNFPLHLIGKVNVVYNSHYEMVYEKILPILYTLLTAIPIYLIIRKFGKSVKTAMFGVLLFLTAGTVFIPVVCWGMYDIIPTFFITLGFYFLIRDESRWDLIIAMLLCGLGFATKSYGVFIFLPVLAYRCNKLHQAVGYGLLSLVPVLASRLVYMRSKAFGGQAENSNHFTSRLFSVSIDTGYFKISVFLLGIFALTMITYGMKYDPANKIKAIYLTLPGGVLFYGLVTWHPQWLTLIIPFLCITTAVSSKRSIYMFYDVLLAVFYSIHTLTMWTQFDVGLIRTSYFNRFLVSNPSPFFWKKYFPPKYASAYSAIVIAILLANCILKNPFVSNSQYETSSEISVKDKCYASLRFILGTGFYCGSIFLWFLLNLKH